MSEATAGTSGPRPALPEDLREDLVALLTDVAALEAAYVVREADSPAARRLRDAVVRPLSEALALPQAPAAAGAEPTRSAWELAQAATRLCARRFAPAGLLEATAALQDLACQQAPGHGPDTTAARIEHLVALQRDLPASVRPVDNGPYLVTGAQNVVNHLGERIATRPLMALCRCGESESKPSCDATCARIGFTTEKNPDRVADRRDTYVGQQVTVLDNRGTCQHSGRCTDRLATVFHLGEEPFVTPSGGRMDEIIRAVRDCPSGALSYALDGVEARGQVDYAGRREPAIEISKDGPYRITGGIPLLDGDDAVSRNEGASPEHYALCRCGHSENKPFCSGMHWYVNFTDPVPDPEHTPTMFEWCGGYPALTRMTRLFYERYVPQDPLLAPVFANMSADHPQRVAAWLGEVFGGPPSYSEQYGGYQRMISQHVGKRLTDEWRARWVALMSQSAQESGMPNDAEFRSAFGSYLEWGSRLAVENSQTDAHPPAHMPMPRWDWGTAGPPGSRVSALGPATADPEAAVVLPAAEEPVTFEKHIKALFRSTDRQSMSFAFDLWSYADVREHADAILARLVSGTMPCDGAWPAERVEAFRRWVDSGKSA